ncbi:MAG: hypothetical protein ACOYOA_14245 [Saprospiraceae bacterium]
MNTQTLPTQFSSRMQTQLGDAFEAFTSALADTPPISIRQNPCKPSKPFENTTSIPWEPNGRYLPERPSFTLDPLFHAGAYYVQEASSMLIGHALKQVVDFDRSRRVLDQNRR